MPRLFGSSLRAARILIERSGLTVGGVTRAPSDEVGEGLVAGTDPPAETVLPRATPVSLLVSTGGATESYVMPELLGRDLGAVRRQLEALGFRVVSPAGAGRARHDPVAGPGAGHARGPRHGHHPAGQREVVVMSPVTHPLTGPIIAPSLLSADFARLAEALAVVDPARDWVHCDVMDNHFVPNLTFGPLIVAAARRLVAGVPRRAPDDRAARVAAGALPRGRRRPGHRARRGLRRPGGDAGRGARERRARAACRCGRARRWPRSSRGSTGLDLLLVMTVEPGFGGQSFMADMLEKVRAAREWRERHGARFLIEVDGGIAPATAPAARAAGADVFVAGNAIYGQADPAAALAALRAAVR